MNLLNFFKSHPALLDEPIPKLNSYGDNVATQQSIHEAALTPEGLARLRQFGIDTDDHHKQQSTGKQTPYLTLDMIEKPQTFNDKRNQDRDQEEAVRRLLS